MAADDDRMCGSPVPQADPSVTVTVVVRGGPGEVSRMSQAVLVLLEGGYADLVRCDVGALDQPDVGTVGALARLHVRARRVGAAIRLCNVPLGLRRLLTFLGLDGVLPCEDDHPP